MERKEQILDFINCCEELKSCKFIMATTRIKDLLKCIVNSPDLYMLFEAVTKDFDYLAAKSKYLITGGSGMFESCRVVLPKTVGDRLAFIFCLLAEFDKDSINFNDFLRKYFSEDGSYFASYQAFCSTIIDGLKNAVLQAFDKELSENNVASGRGTAGNAHKAELLSAVNLAILAEIQFITQSNLSDEDKSGGIKILNQLFLAVKADNRELVEALICGYNYFCLFHKCITERTALVIDTIAEYEQRA